MSTLLKNQEKRYLAAFFNLIEELAGTSLRNTTKELLLSYMQSSDEGDPSIRAREVASRYIDEPIPSLKQIQQKKRRLQPLDHAVLKMEYEAKRLKNVLDTERKRM